MARVVKACGRLRKGAALKHLYFDQEDFGQAVLVEPRFQNCHFDRADFRRLRMVRPVFRECTIQMPMVSLEGTRLDDAASTLATMVTGVAIMPNGRVNPPAEKAYAPDQIRAILVRLGMQGEEGEDTQSYAAEQRERIQLLERFLLKMERRFYVAAEDFPQLGLRGPVWDDVYRLLQEHGITREEQRQVSGPRRPLLRLGYPPDIIRRGENTEDGRRPEIQRFWSELLNVK